jgi:hypothetical protein
MQPLTGPASPKPVRPGFWPETDGFGPPASGAPIGRELVVRSVQGVRVDARTAELRDRIAKAARTPLIGGLLLLMR